MAALAALRTFLGVVVANGQFGGYTPPAPNCPSFKCPANQRAVGRLDHQIWSYGCKEAGMNILSANSFDPNNPFAGMQQKNVDKCCVERDICKQTCGMTSKACHDNFQKCSHKICKGDQNCMLQAHMSEIMSEPYDDPDYTADSDKKYDPQERTCRGYVRGQNDACQCVPSDEFESGTESKLKAFYKKFNPEKLHADGEIKDVGDVWKKWKGKEHDMFLALATKYKAKAVEIREKPKPPPYTPPTPKEETAKESHSDEPNGAAEDPEDAAFDNKKKELQSQKTKAVEEEDFDAADKAKDSMAELTVAEVARLKAKKAEALKVEDYMEAKRIKLRLQKIEL